MAFHSGTHTHDFCRHLLAETMKEVRQNFIPAQIKAVWVWTGDRRDFEFHGPSGEYIYNLKLADCCWSAKAEGWQRMLEAKNCLDGKGAE